MQIMPAEQKLLCTTDQVTFCHTFQYVWVLETCVLIIIIQPIGSIWVWKALPKSRFICCPGPHPHELQTIPATMSFDEGTWEIQHLQHVKKMVHVELWVTKYRVWMGIGVTNQLHCVVPLPPPTIYLNLPFYPFMKIHENHSASIAYNGPIVSWFDPLKWWWTKFFNTLVCHQPWWHGGTYNAT
jgi:hypothetical protein